MHLVFINEKAVASICFLSQIFPVKRNVLHCLGMSLEEHAIKHDSAFSEANIDPEEMPSPKFRNCSIRLLVVSGNVPHQV